MEKLAKNKIHQTYSLHERHILMTIVKKDYINNRTIVILFMFGHFNESKTT